MKPAGYLAAGTVTAPAAVAFPRRPVHPARVVLRGRFTPLGRLTLLACLAFLLLVGPRGASACTDDPFLVELRATGDDFRAVTLMKEREFRRRGSDEGFTCARLLLGEYLRHDELDLADAWLDRLLGFYPQAVAFGPASRLRSELAYRFGNFAEMRRRQAVGPALPAAEPLLLVAQAREAPLTFTPPACAAPACVALRAVAASPRPRKSPGLALALGLVPGLGQIYAGRVAAGVGSFLLHGFLFGVTAFGAARGEAALALFSGGIGGALYLGNLYAGYEAARRANEAAAALVDKRLSAIPLDLAIERLAL